MSRLAAKRYSRILVGIIIGAAIVMTAPVASHADDPPPQTNLEIITTLTNTVASRLLAGFEPKLLGRGVRLSPVATNEQYQLVGNIFTRILSEAGTTTYLAANPKNAVVDTLYDVLVLEYEIQEFHLAYTDISRRFLIGGKRVSRSSGVSVLGKLIDPNAGSVLWVGEASESHDDHFPHGDLTYVQKGNYLFTKPAVPSSGVGKYVEPVLVSGIIVGLIYLFFSNQSDS